MMRKTSVPPRGVPTGLAAFAAWLALLLAPIAVTAAGGDLLWQGGAPAADRQEAKAAAVDSRGDLLLVGSGAAVAGEGRVVKLAGDGSGPRWTATFNLNGGLDTAAAVAIDGNDDVLVVGYGNNGVNYDLFTTKYAGTDGSLLWQYVYDGPAAGDDFATGVAVDSLGYVYVCGYSQGGSGREDGLLLKFDPGGPNPDGTPLWLRRWNADADGHDRFLAVAAGTGGVVVTGKSQNALPDFDPVTVSFDPLGTLQWARSYSDPGDGEGRDVAIDPAGDAVMAGTVHNGSDRDLFVIKYAGVEGTPRWVTAVDNGYDDEAEALGLDGAEGVYVTGTSFSVTSHVDALTLKFAGADGAELWRDRYNSADGNGEYPAALAMDGAEDLFVAGYRDEAASGQDDMLVLKYAMDSGTLIWDRTFDGNGHHDRGVGLGLTPEGTLLLGGWSDRWTTGASDYDFYAAAYDPGILHPPTDLVAQVLSNTAVRLSWTDNSGTEEGFVVERRLGETGLFVPVASLAADATTFEDTGLTPDSHYVYRVKAVSALSGDSPFSDPVFIWTTIVTEQAPDWLIQIDGADGGDDYPEAIAIGPDHRPVVTGASFSLEGAFDYLTVKVDRETGDALWRARYDDPDFESDFATSVTVDTHNRVVVTGYASLYGGGAGNTNDVFTLGYPATGAPAAWSDQYNGPSGGDDRSAAVATATDGSDNTVVVGYGKNAAWNDDIYVLKYLADGSRAWAAQPFDGGGDDYPVAVAFDPGGDVLVVGRSAGAGGDDLFVARYAGNDGSLLWHRLYDGPGGGDDYAEALAVNAAGQLYAAGYASGAGGSGDACLLKYDGAGNLLWSRLYDGVGGSYDIAKGVAVDPIDQEVIVAVTSFVGPGNHDLVLLNYDRDGALRREKRLERPGSDEAVAAMALDRYGIVTVAASSDDDILAVKFDHDGTAVGANLVDGGYGVDAPVALAVNDLDEAYVAGFVHNASGNADYLVFRAAGSVLPPPWPATANAAINRVDLSWSDNAADEAGILLQRHPGSCSDPDIAWPAGEELPPDSAGYADTGLSQGTTYCYRLSAYRTNGEFSRPVLLEATTALPQAPTELTATPVNTTEIRLDWTDPTVDGESGYVFIVQRCSGSGCSFSPDDPLFTVPAPAGSWIDDTACPATSYSYRVLAKKEGLWASEFSLPAAAATPAVGGAPAALSAVRLSETAVRLEWTDRTTDETGFHIERCLGADCTVLTGPADQTWFEDSGLQLETTYTYRVRAFKNAGQASCDWETAASNDASVSTDLLGPGSPAAAAVDTTRVDLSWIDRSGGETGFAIERCEIAGGVLCDQAVQFVPLTVTTADATAYSDTTVCSGGQYRYRLRAQKSDAPSWSTDWATTAAVTLAGPVAPSDPGVVLLSEQEVRLSWADTASDESGFIIERCTGAGCSDFQEIARTGADVTAYADAGLSPETDYAYRVRVFKDAACPWQSAATDPPVTVATVPPAPDALAASVIDTTRIDLSWTDGTAGETAFVVQRCPGTGTACDEDAEFTLVATLAAGATAYHDGEVCAGSDYTYRVRVERSDAPAWQSAWSTIETATANASAPAALVLDAPAENAVDVRWDDVSSDESGFVLQRCSGDLIACSGEADFTPLASFPASAPGLRLLYHLEEPAWSVAGAVLDSSGNGSNGTASGALPIAEGYWERGALFAGGDYITAPITVDQSGAIAATFEAWVQPTVSDNYYRHVLSTDNGGRDWGILIRNGTWYVANGSTWLATGVAAPAGEWHHVAVVFIPGTGLRFYLDGALAYSYGYVYNDSSTGNLAIGRYPATTSSYYQFIGRLDEVAVFEGALDAASIQAHYRYGVQRLHYRDEPLAPGGTYTYRVLGQKSAACPWTAASSASIALAPPPPPTDLMVAPAGTTALELAWQDHAATESGYRIERCTGGGIACDEDAEFALLTTVEADAVAYSDTDGICSGITYSYRVRAVNENDPTWQSAWAGAYGTTDSPQPPAGLVVTGASEEQLDLAWSYPDPDRTGFRIYRCAGDAAACAAAPFAQVAEVVTVGTDLVYSDPGLASGSSYTYRVAAYKTASCPWEGTPAEVTGTTVSPPAPAAFTAAAVDTTTVDLSWSDRTTSETGLRLERCSGEGCSDFAPLAELPADTVGYRDGGLCSATSYRYRLRAERTVSPVWQTAWTTAETTTQSPVAPSDLSASRLSEVEVGLSWTDASADESGFAIERCSGSACSDFIQVAEVAADQTAYSDPALAPQTDYRYRVQAVKSGACGWTSAPSNAVAIGTELLGPGDFAVTTVDSTRLDISWSDREATETGLELERCAGTGCNDFAPLASLPADTTTYSDTGVCSGQIYRYRLRSERTAPPLWQSPWAGPAAGATPAPQAPAGLVAERVSEAEIALSWSESLPDENGFRIERCAGAGCNEFAPLTSVAPDRTSYNDTVGIAAGDSYSYRVIAYKEAACGWESTPSGSATAIAELLPPGSLTATPADTTSIQLAWQDRTATETGLRLERCAGSGSACDEAAEFNLLVSLAADATSYIDTGACSETNYSYRLRAEKTGDPGWVSTWSATAATTPGPAAPVLGLDAAAPDRVELSWNDPTADESEFRVERCAGAGCGDFQQVAALGADTTTYTDTAVAPSTVYIYRVRPAKNALCSWPAIYSNEANVLTLPAAVTDLVANARDSMTVDLQWTDDATDEEGYEIEVQIWNGRFVPIGKVAADVRVFTDTDVRPERGYRYRVRPFRGAEVSPWSNEAAVTTPAYVDGDGGCLP